MPKKRTKKSKPIFTIRTALLIAVIIIAFFIVGNLAEVLTKDQKKDVTKVDIFSIEGITGDLVSVKGIKLGDDAEYVKKELGNPDIQSLHPPNIVNWEYAESLDLPSTGMLIHMEAGIVTRISVFKPFEKLMKTKMDYTKEEIYRKFGAPDKTRLEKVRNRAQIVAAYEKLGFEFILIGSDLTGFVVMYPA